MGDITQSKVLVAALALLATLSAPGGCARRATGPKRFHVRGTVTFDGKPVPSGTIYFEPDASQGNMGPVSVVPITDGRYDTVAAKVPGPLEGPLSIRIAGYPPHNPDVEFQNPLFPEYKTQANLVPATGPAVMDFDIPKQRRK